MSDWYYAKDNQQMGPKNKSEIEASIAAGELPASTLVWKDGMRGWLPAHQVPVFSISPPPYRAKVQPASTMPASLNSGERTHDDETMESKPLFLVLRREPFDEIESGNRVSGAH